MNKNLPKSFWAVMAGFLFTVALSIGTDILLIKTGVLKQPFQYNSNIFIVTVIGYRTVYGIAGSYVTAWLAPNRPMLHVMIPGGIGFIVTIIGTIIMWDNPPHWYAISLIVLALPTAWFGGWLKIPRQTIIK